LTRIRTSALVRGTVQGVGFRPFVYRLATSLGLAGMVRNSPRGVVIELEGERGAVSAFLERLTREAPPLASISAVETSELEPAGLTRFEIVDSAPGARPTALIPPDVALCPDCAREISDPIDRRFRYPFTNCTSCGPRFSIVLGIPYDRPQTTMAPFHMCLDCESEYRDPTDRRFHAEPIACPKCGPRLFLDGKPAPDSVEQAARLLAGGKILAIKGLGGYHLACDARNAIAVETLRSRKGRGRKPFAVMVRDLSEAGRVAVLSRAAESLLTSPESPVVVLPARADSGLPHGIAPKQATVGIMLPYTPLHRLLLHQSPAALVMTSGNLAEEPIVHRDDEARAKLSPIADHILAHDREIAVPCDDSVVRCDGDLVIPVRRARGYVPRSIPFDYDGPPVLAVGGHHRNTFCLLREGEAILSQHIGDIESIEVLDYFAEAIAHFGRLFEVDPHIIAHDLHPGYLATQYARSLAGMQLVPVQHHHAHIVSVMAELGLLGPVIGVAYDGTGYGADGTIWGGEILIAGRTDFQRACHLRPIPLPGGEASITHPSRTALAYLIESLGPSDAERAASDLLPALTAAERRIVLRQVERKLNSPLCSSMGRLFDAVGALLGASAAPTYEGQPAMELESMAADLDCQAPPYSYTIDRDMIDPRPMLREITADLRQNLDRSTVAARFHETVAAFTVDACARVSRTAGTNGVVLSGGVMQNARLVSSLLGRFAHSGLRAHVHKAVPPNDGGISLGQAAVAGAMNADSTVL